MGFKHAWTRTVGPHLQSEKIGEIVVQILSSHMNILHVTNQAGE